MLLIHKFSSLTYNNIDNSYIINLSYCKHKTLFITYLYCTQQQQSSQELSNEPNEETLPSHSTQQGNVRHNNNHYILYMMTSTNQLYLPIQFMLL